MDNNVSKNRFFSRSIQLVLILDQISIKQIILKQLRNAIIQRLALDEIAIYRTENCIAQKLDRVLTSLSDKVILQDNSDFPSLVYCCAIAFPVANLCGLPSLQVAQELVSLLPINTQESAAEYTLQFTVRVIKNGLIEFVLSDRSIGLWLELGIRRWGDGEMGRWGDKGDRGERGDKDTREIGDYNLFPVQYVHDRCCSLLRLGEREGLINLIDGDFQTDTWQIVNPNPFKYYCDANIGYFYESAELNLLRRISVIIDYISDRNSPDPKTGIQLALNLSDACLEFIAACRIFGSVAQNQRDLAIARLGLIVIVQRCLQTLIMPDK